MDFSELNFLLKLLNFYLFFDRTEKKTLLAPKN